MQNRDERMMQLSGKWKILLKDKKREEEEEEKEEADIVGFNYKPAALTMENTRFPSTFSL